MTFIYSYCGRIRSIARDAVERTVRLVPTIVFVSH